MSLKELKSEILEQGNQIEKALDLGADIVAVQLINVISNILNSKNDTSSNFLAENQQVSLRQDNPILFEERDISIFNSYIGNLVLGSYVRLSIYITAPR